MDLTGVTVLFPHCGSCDDTQGSFPFQKWIYYPDILFPTSRRMKTCKYYMIYNGATNKKYKICRLKKSEFHIQVYLGKQKLFFKKVEVQNGRSLNTVQPRYNDMPREQWNYIVISRYRYIETPDITI